MSSFCLRICFSKVAMISSFSLRFCRLLLIGADISSSSSSWWLSSKAAVAAWWLLQLFAAISPVVPPSCSCSCRRPCLCCCWRSISLFVTVSLVATNSKVSRSTWFFSCSACFTSRSTFSISDSTFLISVSIPSTSFWSVLTVFLISSSSARRRPA